VLVVVDWYRSACELQRAAWHGQCSGVVQRHHFSRLLAPHWRPRPTYQLARLSKYARPLTSDELIIIIIITRYQKHRPAAGDNAHRQNIVTHICFCTWLELITISTVTTRSIWHNAATDSLHFGKFPTQICESCGDTYRRNCETFNAL